MRRSDASVGVLESGRQALADAADAAREVAPRVVEAGRRELGLRTHRIRSLPIVVLMPHSGCDCRCVMCDIWKANSERRELQPEDLERHMEAFDRLRVQWIVLSGGEALLHRNLWNLCALLRRRDVRITLLSTGLTLGRHADDVVRWVDDVIVSLDGPREVHDAIRRVPRAYDRLVASVASLRDRDPDFRVTARSVVQRRNHAHLVDLVDAARAAGLDGVSFLAADVTSTAFNRPDGWTTERTDDVAPTADEVAVLRDEVERLIRQRAAAISSGYVAESPEKLRRIVQHFAALDGDGEPPPVHCTAPWVSTVVEADGTVRPCFFHEPLGNIHEQRLDQVLNSRQAIDFRRDLDVRTDPVCAHCTCSLDLRPWARVDASAD